MCTCGIELLVLIVFLAHCIASHLYLCHVLGQECFSPNFSRISPSKSFPMLPPQHVCLHKTDSTYHTLCSTVWVSLQRCVLFVRRLNSLFPVLHIFRRFGIWVYIPKCGKSMTQTVLLHFSPGTSPLRCGNIFLIPFFLSFSVTTWLLPPTDLDIYRLHEQYHNSQGCLDRL